MNPRRYLHWLVVFGLFAIVVAAIYATTIHAAPAPLGSQQAEGQRANLPSSHYHVSSDIVTHTVWSLANSPYVVAEDVNVDPGIVLTLEPGVQVRFDGNYAFNIQGTLLAEGTEAQPILLTSNAATPAPGDWAMLDFRSDSENSVLRHAVVEYGGNATRAGWDCVSGALCVHSSSFLLDESTVRHSATRGLVLAQSDAIIQHSIFQDQAEEAIRLHHCNYGIGVCRPDIVSNTFTRNASAIVRASAQDPYLAGNEALDNGVNGHLLESCVYVGDNTWYSDLPYVIPGWCDIGGYGPVRLTLNPGTVVKIDGGGVVFKYTSIVSAAGTVDQPVTFTSLADDSVGGDTANDGGATTPAPNDYHHVLLTGGDVTALFEHTRFRYGGGGRIGTGPLVWVDYGALVALRDCDLGHSEVGITLWRDGRGQIEASDFHDLSNIGVDASSEGDLAIVGNAIEGMVNGVSIWAGAPLVENNDLDGCDAGVYVGFGSPQLVGNRFEDNTTAVHVYCNPNLGTCAPTVSPHNRFVGTAQQGIVNDWPLDQCVMARDNWWGDESGPADPSSATDACGLIDNPGSGAHSSDGVDYSPWEGGVARPLIASPGCGETARTRPDFVGRSQSGATVTFYDGEGTLGQTTVGGDHTFAWTPTVPFTDGLHMITARATLGGESSLPSPELPLTVSSTLPFDPAGVTISYRFHDVLYTQRLRDASGCASATGDLSLPVWVRPGSIMTVVVPFNTEYLPPTRTGGKDASLSHFVESAAVPSGPNADGRVINFTNGNHDLEAVGYRYSVQAGVYSRLYGDYGPVHPFPEPLGHGDSEDLTLPDSGAYYDVQYVDAQGRTIHRQEAGPNQYQSNDHAAPNLGVDKITLNNIADRKWRVFFARPRAPDDWLPGNDYYGGSLISASDPLGWQDEETVYLPRGGSVVNVIAVDQDDKMAFRQFIWSGDGWRPNTLDFETDESVPFVMTNREDSWVSEIHIYRYREGQDTKSSHPPAVDILPFKEKSFLKPGHSTTIDLEPGNYHFQAVMVGGRKINKYMEVNATSKSWDIKECIPPGSVRNGTQNWPLRKPDGPQRETAEAVFEDYAASGAAEPGNLAIEICILGDGGTSEWTVGAGDVLIDPDGYVYDALLGVGAVIEGATVTCDLYDEDMLTWDRWPAELYESQINPQVTGVDGYYAFFVPAGLYRVRAEATRYLPHTSPDIRVISEIVHYNVPLNREAGYEVYLPMVVRDH